jgi:glyceraldehyde-3-phosphate dehydrogenase/erythrose-4-phosphate dehydrogenase
LNVKDGSAALSCEHLGVDIVVALTGFFTQEKKAEGHLKAGAKK